MSQSKNKLIIGNVLQRIDQCDSTNFYVKQVLSKSKPLEGSVYYTDNQTAGRGQFGNKWQSAPNQNLTFSVLLYPSFLPINKQFYLSKIVSLALVDALQSLTNLPFEIKWPNDIYYKNKKIAGILIENQLSGSQVSSAILGIGINVNQDAFEGLPNAASLFNLVRYLFNKKKVLDVVLEHLDAQYLKLLAKKYEAIDKAYHSKLLYAGEAFQFTENGEKKQGFLKQVNEQGQLEVLVNGSLKSYNFKEIAWVI